MARPSFYFAKLQALGYYDLCCLGRSLRFFGLRLTVTLSQLSNRVLRRKVRVEEDSWAWLLCRLLMAMLLARAREQFDGPKTNHHLPPEPMLVPSAACCEDDDNITNRVSSNQ